MVLAQSAIQSEINQGHIIIAPEFILKEASVKAHLAGIFGETMDSLKPSKTYTLKPKGFVLAKVKEIITLPADIAAFYDGYVGVATKGLFTHGSSMFIDPAQTAQITLEMFNASDQEILLEKDMRVGQYIFVKLAL